MKIARTLSLCGLSLVALSLCVACGDVSVSDDPGRDGWSSASELTVVPTRDVEASGDTTAPQTGDVAASGDTTAPHTDDVGAGPDVAPDPDTGGPLCHPDCGDRRCGPDPVCGESCGSCDDGLLCTEDVCNGEGWCEYPLRGETCLVDGVCHEEGAPDPENPCALCAPERDAQAWSAAEDGAICEAGSCEGLWWTEPKSCEAGQCAGGGASRNCIDYIPCTDNHCDPETGCGATLQGGYCLLYRTCLLEGEPNPADSCQVCVPGQSVDEWPVVCTTDVSARLTWQDPPATDRMAWQDAVSYCENLSLAGGGWRLPSVSELRSSIRGCSSTVTNGSCRVTDSCTSSACRLVAECEPREIGQGPSAGCYFVLPHRVGTCQRYWSASPVSDYGNLAWAIVFNNANIVATDVEQAHGVRCVR